MYKITSFIENGDFNLILKCRNFSILMLVLLEIYQQLLTARDIKCEVKCLFILFNR